MPKMKFLGALEAENLTKQKWEPCTNNNITEEALVPPLPLLYF